MFHVNRAVLKFEKRVYSELGISSQDAGYSVVFHVNRDGSIIRTIEVVYGAL